MMRLADRKEEGGHCCPPPAHHGIDAITPPADDSQIVHNRNPTPKVRQTANSRIAPSDDQSHPLWGHHRVS